MSEHIDGMVRAGLCPKCGAPATTDVWCSSETCDLRLLSKRELTDGEKEYARTLAPAPSKQRVGELAALIAEIEAAHKAATPGLWHASGPVAEHPNSIIAGVRGICGMHDAGQTRESIDANVRLVITLRNSVPAILSALRRAAKLEAVAEAAESMVIRVDEIDKVGGFSFGVSLALAHGMEYKGPTFEEPLVALRAALAAAREEPAGAPPERKEAPK